MPIFIMLVAWTGGIDAFIDEVSKLHEVYLYSQYSH